MIDELMTQEEAELVLAPHTAALEEILNASWADWLSVVKTHPFMGLGRATSRANMVYDQMALRAEAYFDSLGIPTSRSRGFLAVSLADGRMILRFKKFRGPSLRTSGIPTQQRLEIDRQQVTLDGAAVTYVVVGYLPDDLGLNLEVLAIACSYGSRLLWRIDLDEFGESTIQPISTTPPVGPNIRSTRPAAQEEQTEG